MPVLDFERDLREKRARGRKLLAIYVTAGVRDDWVSLLHAACEGGADVVEVGIPFSDPVMDGSVIQAASQRALERGVAPLATLRELHTTVFVSPYVVMSYYNPVLRAGEERFADALVTSGASGAILPDLPVDEAASWMACAATRSLATVFLVSPTTSEARLRHVTEKTSGFVYAIGRLGVTGEQTQLAHTANEIADRVKRVTDKPTLVGIGVSTPAQAAEVCEHADGVIVGSAVMRRVLDGASVADIADFVGALRTAIN